MFVYIAIYCVLIFLLFFIKKSNVIVYVSLFYLAVLFILNTNIADRTNYEFVLNNGFLSGAELGWDFFIFLVRQVGLSVQSLYFIVGIPYLIVLFFVLKKVSQNNRVLACYMIGMFFLDVVQLRFTFSSIFIWLAFYFFFTQNDKSAYAKYILLVFVASLFHASNLIFLVFIFSKSERRSKVFGATATFFCVFAIGLPIVTSMLGSLFNIESKIDRIVEGSGKMASSLAIYSNLFYLFVFLLVAFLMIYNTSLKEKGIIYAQNISVLTLSFVPLVFFSRDFRRQIFVVALILITLFFKYEDKYKDKLLFILPILLFVAFFLYSTFSGNRETVFLPIFENNYLINCFRDFI